VIHLFAREPPFGYSLLEAHLRSHLQGPQAAVLAEAPRVLMKHLPESLGALGVEGRVDGMRPGGAPAQRRLKSTLVEEMDGVAGALGVAPEAAGDLVSVLAFGAGEKYLAPAEDESIRRAQACLQGLALGVAQRTHEDWSSHVVEDNSSTTASSEHALGRSLDCFILQELWA
jgi:hypothetical protein